MAAQAHVILGRMPSDLFYQWLVPQIILNTPPSEPVLKIPASMFANGEDEIIAERTEIGTFRPVTRVCIPLRQEGDALNKKCKDALFGPPDILQARLRDLESHFRNFDWADARIRTAEMTYSFFSILRKTLLLQNANAIRAIDKLLNYFPLKRREQLKFGVLVQVIQQTQSQLRPFNADFAMKLIREYFKEENLLDKKDHNKKNVLHHAYAAGVWPVINYAYEHCDVNVMVESDNLDDAELNRNLIVTFLEEQCFCYKMDLIKAAELKRLLRHISVPNTEDGVASIIKMLKQISGILRTYDIISEDNLKLKEHVQSECLKHLKTMAQTKIVSVVIVLLQIQHIPKDIIRRICDEFVCKDI